MKTLITTLALLTSLINFAQIFEGEIIYTNTYKTKSPQITNEQWMHLVGSVQHFYIKGNHYKSESNGNLVQWQMYDPTSNKLYNKTSQSDVLLWNDASVKNEEILSSSIKPHAMTILGYDCDELTITCKSGIQKYYYSAKLAADCQLYEKHVYANWYDFLKLAKAMSLKSIIETPQFTLEQTATEVISKKLEDSFFTFPADTKTAKSPY